MCDVALAFASFSRPYQHHAEKLRMSDSPLQHMQRVFQGTQGVNEAELRRQLGESAGGSRPVFNSSM